MKNGLLALSPIAVFLLVYLAASIIAGDFYRVPIGVAFLVASIYGIAVTRGLPLRERINIFSAGAGTSCSCFGYSSLPVPLQPPPKPWELSMPRFNYHFNFYQITCC